MRSRTKFSVVGVFLFCLACGDGGLTASDISGIWKEGPVVWGSSCGLDTSKFKTVDYTKFSKTTDDQVNAYDCETSACTKSALFGTADILDSVLEFGTQKKTSLDSKLDCNSVIDATYKYVFQDDSTGTLSINMPTKLVGSDCATMKKVSTGLAALDGCLVTVNGPVTRYQ